MSNGSGAIPPGRGRVSKAARIGLFPVPAPLVLGSSFLAGYAMFALFGAQSALQVKSMVHQGLRSAVYLREEPLEFLRQSITDGLWIALPFLVVPFAAAIVAAFVPALFFRKDKGRTAVELPRAPKTRTVVAILRGAGLMLFFLITLNILRGNSLMVPEFIDGRIDATSRLGTVVADLLGALGVVATLLGLIELFYVRALVWRSLHLTSSEARREARAAGGDREIMSERRRRARAEVRS
jgi:flagellar biosynthesis protein FlhB